MNKYRHEYKYLIDSKEMAVLNIRAAGILQRDSHAGSEGSYFIQSLYFDDMKNSCDSENEAGTDPRSKFRIRYYNRNTESLKLEKKSKIRGMTRKESCSITREE
ncbi:MAG: VTC domain-containing protein, partial [Lachnospiraceae bacterium]|nr:VTC domain-containing protein [Lachnospiraceae bacterium]